MNRRREQERRRAEDALLDIDCGTLGGVMDVTTGHVHLDTDGLFGTDGFPDPDSQPDAATHTSTRYPDEPPF